MGDYKRENVKKTRILTLPKYPLQHCNYTGDHGLKVHNYTLELGG